MKILYQARDRIEAQMLLDHLATGHVKAVLLGDYLSGAAGELSALNFPTVWVVHDPDLDKGQELLTAFLQRQQQDESGDWRCEHCSAEVGAAFEICWNCGAGRRQ